MHCLICLSPPINTSRWIGRLDQQHQRLLLPPTLQACRDVEPPSEEHPLWLFNLHLLPVEQGSHAVVDAIQAQPGLLPRGRFPRLWQLECVAPPEGVEAWAVENIRYSGIIRAYVGMRDEPIRDKGSQGCAWDRCWHPDLQQGHLA